MARKGSITFVPSAAKNPGGGFPADMIPDDVKREVEEIFSALARTGSGRMTVDYDTAEEVKTYRRQVEAYCKNRPTDPATIQKLFADYTPEELHESFGVKTVAEAILTGGPLKFRQSPVKDAPDTQLNFRIVAIPAADPATAEITKAVDAVNAANDESTKTVDGVNEVAAAPATGASETSGTTSRIKTKR